MQHKEQWQAAFGDVMLLAVESQAVGIGGVDDLERALKWLMLLPQLLLRKPKRGGKNGHRASATYFNLWR